MTDVSTGWLRTRGTWWRLGLVATGVAALAIGVAVVARSGEEPIPNGAAGTSTTAPSSQAPPPSQSAGASVADTSPFGDQIVHEGDAVSGAGTVVKAPGEPTMLCRTLPMLTIALPAGEMPPPACSPLAVPLGGVDESALPGWIERDGVWFTVDTVTVTGVWRDGALAVGSVAIGGSAGPTEPADHWRVPCSPPPGGWVEGDGVLSAGVEPLAYEEILAELAGEVTAHPEQYHGQWIGYPDGDPMAPSAPTTELGEPAPAHRVMIVSTVDDPTGGHDELAEVYPGNLCVTRVEHSTAELDAVIARLVVPDGSWVLDAHALYRSTSNRVLLEPPVLDAAAAARIGADAAMVEVWPLVRAAAAPDAE